MDVYEELRQRNDLEKDLLRQKNLVCCLQAKIQAFQGEIKQSRHDVINAEQIVNTFLQEMKTREANMQQKITELESKLEQKDKLLESKSRALEKLANDSMSGFSSAENDLTDSKANKSRAALYEETAELRQSLTQKQLEADDYAQKYNDLLKEVSREPYQAVLEKDRQLREQEESLKELQVELLEEQRRVSELDLEKARLRKRAEELDRQNTMLIAQFSEQFLPCYYSDEVTEEDVSSKFEDIQKIIQLNIHLQQVLGELQSNQESSEAHAEELKSELDDVKSRLVAFEKEAEQSVVQIKRLQTSADFYKMKWEENGDGDARGESMPMELDDPKNLRKRPHPDSDSYKVQVDLNLISERLAALLKEKQQTEENYEELLEKKDKLILELHASKVALELKVQTQSSVYEDMEKRLNNADKVCRKLEEQRIKATSEAEAMKTNLEELQLRFNRIEFEKQTFSAENHELTSDLEKVRHEAAELQSKCEMLAKNENVSETVANTLEEFRSACSQMNNDQLKQATEQIESLRKDNEALANFVKAMNGQQLFAVESKTDLAETQSQRDVYLEECTSLKQKLIDLELERDARLQDFTALKQKLTDLQLERDAKLEECTALKQKLTDLELERDAKLEECTALKQKLTDLQPQRDVHVQESTALKQKRIERLEREIQTLNEKLEKNQVVTEKIRAFAMKYKEGYEKTVKALDTMRDAYNQAKAELHNQAKSEASSAANVEGTNDE
ncbi:hypothetical protein M3Y97_00494500 [Aphelenchoides bicaudatus]|nr:hypothetical protein M3Y97_00494500 [Aphelenchoides bicaudatus]